MKNQRNEPSSLNSRIEPSKMKISNAELASFLRHLASIYKSPITGNMALSNALSELASWVGRRNNIMEKPTKSLGQKLLRDPPLDLSQLKSLDTKAIENFLLDQKKTKLELIDLASVRFSIPRSQLMRVKTSAVRETIKAALLHEGSIEIISQEAARDGSKRNS